MAKLPDGVDGRSRLARQYREIVRDLSKDFGGEAALNVAERELIETAAIMLLRSAAVRTAILNGEVIDDIAVSRLANSSARLMQAVDQRRKATVKPQTLASYLAETKEAS
jgi:hypothetical protein